MTENSDDKTELEDDDFTEVSSTPSDQPLNLSEPGDHLSPPSDEGENQPPTDAPEMDLGAQETGDLDPGIDDVIQMEGEPERVTQGSLEPIQASPENLDNTPVDPDYGGIEEEQESSDKLQEVILPPEFMNIELDLSHADPEQERFETASSDFIDWDWERLKGDLGLASEHPPSSPGDVEGGTDRFRRLIIGDPIDNDENEKFEKLSTLHPTGSPEKTGGTYADEIHETEEIEQTPTSQPGASSQLSEESLDDTPRGAGGRKKSTILPKRVPERDIGATQVSRSAYSPVSAPPPPSRKLRSRFWGELSGCGGCLVRMGILGIFIIIALFIAIASFTLYQYSILAASLPSVEDLQDRAAQFETTRILDRDGNLLYEILDPHAGRRTYVPLDEVSPYLVAAIIATEDSQFYSHPGFDPWGIVRGYVQNVQEGEIVSGSSTITQQIARSLVLDPTERSQRTALRKIREILLAQEITRRYSKDEILELYLNQSYFGNLAYGVEAAAETYFNTTADRLTLSQASFLAGLVQAPSVYDIFTNRDATLVRHQQVLSLMIKTSNEQGCIFVSNNPQPICVSQVDAGTAAAEIENYEFSPVTIGIRFPHWVTYIRFELEQLYDPQTIYRSGFTVYTTLDPYLQEQAQEIISLQVETLADRNAMDGALVAIRPSTGEILAMVGSADFYNEEIDGQVNMAIRPRQPGSSIKPITYIAAFEKGWTPATLIWDVYSEFPPSGNPSDPRPPYKPKNYDRRYHGPVTVRSALANSYNIPAVKALDFVGVYDDPLTPEKDGFISVAERMGITTLTSEEYGLALTLGGGEVTLLDMTSAFSNFANTGLRIPYYSISRIVDHTGELVYEYEIPDGEQVIRPEHAYLITSILSDNNARTPGFGANSVLRLPFEAAAKTGTSEDYTDSWTVGYTPDVTVGVWIGNADHSPMQNLSGLRGAGPAWNEFMQVIIEDLTGGFPRNFIPPAGIMEKAICAISGAEPSEWCPSHRVEIFAFDQPPLTKDQDLWQKVWVDSWTLQLASADCPDHAKEKLGLDVRDAWGRRWIEEEQAGKDWAEQMGFTEDNMYFIPTESCSQDSPRPIVLLTGPGESSTISEGPIDIFGKVTATGNFKDWVLQYGLGFNPSNWTRIKWSDIPHEQPVKLMEWDPQELGNGAVTLRLIVRSQDGGNAEDRLHLNLNLPTPTPTVTPTPTITVTPTTSPTPTPSLTPTPSPTPTPSITPTPSLTPTPSQTASPTPSPTHTP